MLRSFYSGISGLRNHQQAMDVVGNNLANVNTTGYKSSRTTFMDTLNQTVQGARAGNTASGGRNAMQVGLGMTVAAIDRDMNQGALQSTGRNLDLAIEGEGWFVVGELNERAEAAYYYTRAGSFFVDDNANLVSSSGDLVYGWVDTDSSGTVSPTTDQMQFINLDRRGDGTITNALASATPAVSGPNSGNGVMGAITTRATTVSDTWTVECVDAALGLFEVRGARSGVLGSAYDYNTVHSAGVLGDFSVRMNPAGTGAQQATMTQPLPAAAGGTFDVAWDAAEWGAGANDISVAFVNRGANQLQTEVVVDGPAITVFLETNSSGVIQATAGEVYSAFAASTGASALVTMTNPDASATGGADNSGEMVGTFTARYLTGGQGADLGDTFTFTTTAAGGAQLASISVNREGGVIGVFENGATEEIARVALAKVPNPQGLLAVGQGKFVESPVSGTGFPAVVAGTGGTGGIASGFLEMSNVDLAQQFTEMIVNQRGFQANSRIVTTSDEMLQELLALKR